MVRAVTCMVVLVGACGSGRPGQGTHPDGVGHVAFRDARSSQRLAGDTAPIPVLIGSPIEIHTRWSRLCSEVVGGDEDVWSSKTEGPPGRVLVPCEPHRYTAHVRCRGAAATCPDGPRTISATGPFEPDTQFLTTTTVRPRELGVLQIDATLVHASGRQHGASEAFQVLPPETLHVSGAVHTLRPRVEITAFLREKIPIPSDAIQVNGRAVPDQQVDLGELFPERRTDEGRAVAPGSYELQVELGGYRRTFTVVAVDRGPITGAD